jgi:hypothetical protein
MASSYRKYLFVDGDNNNCPRLHLGKTIVEKILLFEQKQILSKKVCFKSGKFLLFKIGMHLMGWFELNFF